MKNLIMFLMTLAAFACGVPLEAAPHALAFADEAVTLSRPSAGEYRIADGPVTYVLRSQNPSPSDPRHEGAGELRMVSMLWTEPAKDPDAAPPTEHELLLCGDCAAIPAVRLPGTAVWSWTAPGYGLQSTPSRRWLLDGVAVDLDVGESESAGVIELRQDVTGFAADGPSSNASSPRKAVIQRVSVAIASPGLWQWSADDLALTSSTRSQASYERGDVYDGRLEGPSICTGGPWDGYRIADGRTFAVDCAVTTQVYATPRPVGDWAELTSTSIPVALRVSTGEALPWVALFNGAHADRKLKLYQLERAGYSSPETVMPGSTRRYAHTIEII